MENLGQIFKKSIRSTETDAHMSVFNHHLVVTSLFYYY